MEKLYSRSDAYFEISGATLARAFGVWLGGSFGPGSDTRPHADTYRPFHIVSPVLTTAAEKDHYRSCVDNALYSGAGGPGLGNSG